MLHLVRATIRLTHDVNEVVKAGSTWTIVRICEEVSVGMFADNNVYLRVQEMWENITSGADIVSFHVEPFNGTKKAFVIVGLHDNRFVSVYQSREAADRFIQRSYRYAPDGVSGYDEYAIAEVPCWSLDEINASFDEAELH